MPAEQDGVWSDVGQMYVDTLTECEDVNTWNQVATQLGVPTFGEQGSNTDAAEFLDFGMCPSLSSFSTLVCQDAASLNR